jgi:hypothetical protein
LAGRPAMNCCNVTGRSRRVRQPGSSRRNASLTAPRRPWLALSSRKARSASASSWMLQHQRKAPPGHQRAEHGEVGHDAGGWNGDALLARQGHETALAAPQRERRRAAQRAFDQARNVRVAAGTRMRRADQLDRPFVGRHHQVDRPIRQHVRNIPYRPSVPAAEDDGLDRVHAAQRVMRRHQRQDPQSTLREGAAETRGRCPVHRCDHHHSRVGRGHVATYHRGPGRYRV